MGRRQENRKKYLTLRHECPPDCKKQLVSVLTTLLFYYSKVLISDLTLHRLANELEIDVNKICSASPFSGAITEKYIPTLPSGLNGALDGSQ